MIMTPKLPRPAVLIFVSVFATALLCAVAATGMAAPPDSQIGWYLDSECSGGRVFRVDAGASHAQTQVGRSGLLAAFGHDHIVTSPGIDGFAWLPDAPDGPPPRADVWLELAALDVDDPELSAEDIAGTRANMLKSLDAGSWPSLVLHAELATPYGLAIDLRLHGVTQRYSVPADITVDAETLRVAGEFTLRQSDHGIRPFRAFGGTLSVRDAVDIRFDLTLALWEPGRCQSPATGL